MIDLRDTLLFLSIVVGCALLYDMFFMGRKNQVVREKIFQLWFSAQELSFVTLLNRTKLLFNDVFDNIYGERHFSFRCFWRSTILSIIFVFLAIIVTHYLGVAYTDIGVQSTYLSAWGTLFGFLEEIAQNKVYALLFVQNIFIDYLSLVETRWLMKRGSNQSVFFLFIILVFDVIFSFALIAVPVLIEYNIYYYLAGNTEVSLNDLTSIFYGGVGKRQILLPFIYSTFGTSIILYSFILSSLALFVLGKLRLRVSVVLERLYQFPRPITVLTTVASIVVSIAITVVDLLATAGGNPAAAITRAVVERSVKQVGDVEHVAISRQETYAAAYFGRVGIPYQPAGGIPSQAAGAEADAIDDTLRIWSLDPFRRIASIKLHSQDPTSQFAPDRCSAKTGLGSDCEVGLLSFSPNEDFLIFSDSAHLYKKTLPDGQIVRLMPNKYFCVVVNPKDQNILFLRAVDRIVVYDLSRHAPLRSFEAKSYDHFRRTDASVTDRSVFFGEVFSPFLIRCDLVTNRCETFPVPEKTHPFSVSRDEKTIALAGPGFDNVDVFSMAELRRNRRKAKPLWHLPPHDNTVTTISFLGPSHLVTGSVDRSVALWNIDERSETLRFRRPGVLSYVSDVAVSPKASRILIGALYGQVFLLRVD